jgi:hypothetical protein
MKIKRQGKPKLLTMYTANQEGLFKQCLEPSAGEFDVINKLAEGPGGEWGSEGFALASTLKSEWIVKGLVDNRNEIVIWADADIIIFDDIYEELTRLLKGSSIAAARSRRGHWRINTGFMAIRADAQMIKLFTEVAGAKKSPKQYDQFHTNKLLKKKKIKPVHLPQRYFHNGLRSSRVNREFDPPDDIKLFHATYHVGDKQKKKALLSMKERVRTMRFQLDDIPDE